MTDYRADWVSCWGLEVFVATLIFALLGLTILSGSVGASPATPAQMNFENLFGVNTHNLSYAPYIRQLGVGWVRIDVPSDIVQELRVAKKEGLRTLVILDDQVVWYETGSDFLPSLQVWKKSITEFVMSFGREVNAYEIWNEPTVFRNGYENGSSYNYYELLCSAYHIIKSLQPDAIVIGLGGVAVYSGPNDSMLERDFEFARGVATLGGGRCMDAFSIHAYDWSNMSNSVWEDWSASIAVYRSDFPGLPFWVTETGTTIFDIGGSQSQFIREAYPLLLQDGARKIFWYMFEENGQGFGLLQVNGTPRPSFFALRMFVHPPAPSRLWKTSED